ADDPAREPLVLQRLAQDAGAVHGLAVVGEAERSGPGQLGHLGQRLAAEAARDRGHEADGDAGLAAGGLAQGEQHRCGVHRRVGVGHRHDRDVAAGGYVAVVAMPNTDPTVDSAPVLLSLREAARREARIPVGFMASITRGLGGEALTEMAELARAGALGFTDDGKPVHRAGILRKALQYQRLAGRVICLHEEDPTLSGRGVMHEGEVSARLGLAGIPSISESTLIARDASLAGYENGRIHIQHLSARESVEAVAAAKAAGVRITAEASPHHLTLTDQ